MKLRHLLGLGLLLLISALPARAELSAWDVLNHTLALQDAVQDYTAHCTLDTDLPGVDVPERQFKVYFKRPDKVKIESRDTVFVPKEALALGNLRRHLTQDTEVTLAGVGNWGQEKLYCLKLKPKSGGDAGRVLVWIRSGNWTPTRTQIWKGDTRLLEITWTFTHVQDTYWMPESMRATIPSGVINDQGAGAVSLTWESYTVNTGLSDDIFKQ
jgi:outer membrane lipoprotein-sorting protein